MENLPKENNWQTTILESAYKLIPIISRMPNLKGYFAAALTKAEDGDITDLKKFFDNNPQYTEKNFEPREQ